MADTDKDPRQLLKEDPERYRVLKSGAIWDSRHGRFIGMDPETQARTGHPITKENAAAMQRKGILARKERANLAELRGLARAGGVDLPPDADYETVLAGALSTGEAITAHLAGLALKTQTLRGAEGYLATLKRILYGDTPEDEKEPEKAPAPQILILLAELARREKAEVIDAQDVDND